MRVEPAHISQIQCASDGRMVEISADAGGVAEDLKRLDPCLKVRFAENGNPPCFIVYHESEDKRSTYLVKSVQAYQGSTGAWLGLDQRTVREIERIGHESYDYATELEDANVRVRKRNRDRFSERVGEIMQHGPAALRKDLGLKNRAFIRKGLPHSGDD